MKIIRIFFCIIAGILFVFIVGNLWFYSKDSLSMLFGFSKEDVPRNVLIAFIALVIFLILFYLTLDFSIGDPGLPAEKQSKKVSHAG